MNKDTPNPPVTSSATDPQGSGSASTPNSLGIHASVSFGTSEGGPCVGKGICKLQSLEPTAIDVHFHCSALSRDILHIIFSLSELKQKQPEQYQYFTSSSKTYQFDKTFVLDNQIFTAMDLYPNARISPDSPTDVLITADTVIALIKYDHDLTK